MIGRAFLVALVACMVPATGQGGTFYCDPARGSPQGDGSIERPWSTLEEVLSARLIQLCEKDGKAINPSAPVKPGDTVLLRSGWHGVVRIPRGYNDRPITIAADKGHLPQVGWIEIGEGRKWLVKGLTVSPSLAPAPLKRPPHDLVMLGEGGGEESAELVVEDCFVYSVLDTSKWTAKDWVEKPASGIWLGRHGKGHVARNNYVLNTRFGINLCAPECLCEGNVVANFSADGIRATRDGQIVQYNVIKNNFVGARDGDDNHDDGIQVFLFNKGTGTLRNITLRGNIILARETDGLPFPNPLQGIGCFDGPLVNFTVEKNVVCVNHYHGVSLYDAQGCTIQDNACFSRWKDKPRPWVMLGQKKNQARGNTVRNNLAHSFGFKADAEVKTENNQEVTEAVFRARLAELAALIDGKFGREHPAAKRPRLEAAPKPPARPQVFLDTRVASTPVTGKTIQVPAGGNFQAAIQNATPGDEIVLQAGATYTGNFLLPAKGASGKWITIRTSNLAGLPKEGERAGPQHAKAMPKIVDPNGSGAISTALNAGYYRLIGLEVTVVPSVKNAWALVKLGSGGEDQKSLATVAHHLILDRLYVHGDPKQNCFRCVALNSAHTAVIDSCLTEGHAQGFDAQAIGGWNGPGPFKIVNNYLEGSGENVMFGGADPLIPDLVPSDIEFRRNHCFKPLSWKIGDPSYAGIPWTVKNLFELKNARRVWIEGNLLENNWVHAQAGTAILFTVRNQNGKAPWSAVQDVTMINNRLRNTPTAFVVMGEDSPNQSQPSQRFLIQNNLFEQIERTAFTITSAADDVEIDHNTFLPTDYSAFFMTGLGGHDASGKVVGKPCKRFKLTNNIMGFGLYGPGVDGGQNTFAEAFPELTWDKNLFVGYGEGRAQSAMTNKAYPAGSLFEPKQTASGASGDADWPAVGFADYPGGNYRLAPKSKYKGLGTDGKDLGVDMDALGAVIKP